MHLIIDGYGGDYQKMQDERMIRDLLDTYPAVLGMTKIAPPHVLRYVDSKPEDWGVSGFVLIAESHISIHTFPERSYINIDIFTCKTFDAERAIKDMVAAFSLGHIETRLLERGIEYPHNIQGALPIAEDERREVAAIAGKRQ